MKIRIKKIGAANLNAEQQKNFDTISLIVNELEKKKDFQTKIGVELVISDPKLGASKLSVSAFNTELLSRFISEVMIETAKLNLPVKFSTKHIEGFNDPVFTNIIIL